MRIASRIPLINQQSLVGADLIVYIKILYKQSKLQKESKLQCSSINILFLHYSITFFMHPLLVCIGMVVLIRFFIFFYKTKNPCSMQQKCSLSLTNLNLDYFVDMQNSQFEHLSIFKNVQKNKPWETLNKISDYLKDFFKHKNATENHGKLIGSPFIDQANIFIGQGTTVQHGAMIKAPAIIGRNCEIRKGAYIRGNVILGDGVIIGNSSQIKNSIIMNNCQIPHFNYIGDSILGTKAHISAGAMTSNFRLDGKTINVCLKQKQTVNTGMIKFGAIIGDGSQIGCNVVLNPGSIIGKNTWIYPNISFRGFLQSNSILKLKQQYVIQQKKDQNIPKQEICEQKLNL